MQISQAFLFKLFIHSPDRPSPQTLLLDIIVRG
jgi:hypothetical protein